MAANEDWVEIKDVKTSYDFKRELIDNIKKKDIVKYKGEFYRVIDGRYGHCDDYLDGFQVKLKKLEK